MLCQQLTDLRSRRRTERRLRLVGKFWLEARQLPGCRRSPGRSDRVVGNGQHQHAHGRRAEAWSTLAVSFDPPSWDYPLSAGVPAAMTANPTIMMLGLPVDVVLGSNSPVPAEARANIAAQIEAVPEQMRTIGVDYTFFGVTMEDSAGLDRLRDALEAKPFDGVVIGNGIRSNPPLTPWLEQLIDVIHVTSPHTKLMFNTEPSTSVDAVRRWFPVAATSRG